MMGLPVTKLYEGAMEVSLNFEHKGKRDQSRGRDRVMHFALAHAERDLAPHLTKEHHRIRNVRRNARTSKV